MSGSAPEAEAPGAGPPGPRLRVPRPRPGALPRPRITDHLDRGATARLTLACAPAGSGKTTALAAWVAGRSDPRPVAWLSLDDEDAAPAAFWTGVVAALQVVAPGLGAGLLPRLASGRAPGRAVPAALLDELAAVPGGLVLLLDDYHLVDGPDVGAGTAFLLEHLPPDVRVVVGSRVDPGLPLARLRARGELVELRATDLRFTGEEVDAFLRAAGLDLPRDAVATLTGRTEGWAAALQLAALSMRDRADPAGFVARFGGDDRHVVDYLVEEVLARQPDGVRDFLLRTSVLDRLTGPLCDTLTGTDGGTATLASLERANLFLVPLDDHRRWYRYHHMFAELLRAQLAQERPGEVAALHRRASRWFDGDGQPVPAVRHALAGGDVDTAADLVERAVPALRRERREATLRDWLEVLPDEVVRVRPVLALGFVGALMSFGEVGDVERRLRDVERWLPDGAGGAPLTGMVVADPAELAHLPALVHLYRAALRLLDGDGAGAVRHAEQAAGSAAPGDHVVRASASALAGLVAWTAGDLDLAHDRYTTCIEGLRQAGHVPDLLGCSITLADLHLARGRLGGARATYEDGLAAVTRRPGVVPRGAADMHAGLALVAVERGDLDAARASLRAAHELGEGAGLPQFPYRWRAASAMLRHAEGDLPAALELVEAAGRVHDADFSPDVRPLAALRARVLVAQGALDAADRWAGERGLSPDDEPVYLREYEHLTLARLLLARHAARRSGTALTQAHHLLESLESAARGGGRDGAVVEALLLRALAHHAGGDPPAARAALERSVELAAPQGHVHVFATAGPALVPLLTAVVRRRGSPFARRLLGACRTADRAARPAAPPAAPLPDPLSPRELQVLGLLGTDLDGPAIARELGVSLNTLRTHTRNVYTKLDVTGRRAAVRRAAELGLPPRPGGR